MTSVFSGSGLGLFGSSLNLLGSGTGNPQLGRFGEQLYINSATGNLVVRSQDEFLVAQGIDLSLVRTYNSQGFLDDDNNDNWRFNIASLFDLPASPNTIGSTISKRFGDGAEIIYTFDVGQNCYVSTAGDGADDSLSYDAGSQQWTWIEGSSRAAEIYNSTGQLVVARDADGKTLHHSYTGALLTQITDDAGQEIHLDYIGNNLEKIRTVSGGVEQTRTRYTYDTSDRLSKVIVDLSPDDNGVSDGNTYVTTYTYDGTSHRVRSITQGDGTAISFTYELANGQYRVKTYTDGEGHTSRFDYVSVTETRFTDPLGYVTIYISDAADRLTRVTGPTGIVTNYDYDAKDNLRLIDDGYGRVTAMEYDASNNLVLTRDALGNTVTRRYDALNQLIAETQYRIPDPDGAGVAQPGAPLTTRYIYDGEGHPRFTVSAEGGVTEYRYDTPGNCIATLQYADERYDLTGLSANDDLTETQLTSWIVTQDLTRLQRTDYTYDALRGQLNKTTTYAATDSGGNGIASDASVTQFVYDQRGQLLQTLDARSSVSADATDNDLPYATTYVYDGLGRVTSTVQWIDAADTRSSLVAYDDTNRSVGITLANGLTTTSTYDQRGLLTSVVQSSGASTLGTTRYQYDAAGRLRITTDPTGVKTNLLYDTAGRCVATIDGTGAVTETIYNDSDNVITTKAYATRLDAMQLASLMVAGEPSPNVSLASLSLLSSVDDRSRYQIRDAVNRLAVELETTDDVSTQGYVTKYFYDGAGRVTDVIQYVNAVSVSASPTLAGIEALISTSADDRQQRRFYDDDGRFVANLDAEGYLTEQVYDAAGNLIETVAYAKSVAVYGAGGVLNAATTQTLRHSGTFSDLKNNMLAQGASVDDQHQYRFYNGKGQLAATLDAENYLTEYTYDAAGNVAEQTRYSTKAAPYNGTQTVAQLRPTDLRAHVTQTHYNGANQVDQSITNPAGTVTKYHYDDAGNLIRTDKAWNTNEVRSTRARYDVQGRVLQELTGKGSVAFDALLTVNPGATSAQIDAVWKSYSLTHTYDVAGRRTSTTDQNDHKTLFYYDADGRLIYTVNALGEVSQTTYTAFGQAHEQIRYANKISTANLSGGLADNDANFTARVAAINAPADIDIATRTHYTLRGAIRDAIDVSYTYNRFGELAHKKVATVGTTLVSSGYLYDSRGLLLRTTEDENGLARVTATQYDAFGRVVQTTDARGVIRASTYDRLGRTITTTLDPDGLNLGQVTEYDAFSRTLNRTDATGKMTSYVYDDAIRCFTLATPEGISIVSISNRHGETVSVSDGVGNVTRYEYDKNGQLTDTLQADGLLNLHTSSDYDHARRKTSTTDANGTVTKYEYDDANRLFTRIVDEDGLNLKTSYRYEGQGRKLTVTDATGVVTETSYDVNGRALDVIVDLNGKKLHTSYLYDRQGKTLTVTEGVGSVRPRTTEYQYDNLGRRERQIDDVGGLNITSTYLYDLNDNLVAKTEALGKPEQRKTRYVYDADNRLTYTVDALGGVVANDYDENGRVGKTARYASAISLGGLADVLSAADITVQLVTDPSRDQVTRYLYDGDGRLVFTADALMNVVERQYDGANRVIRMTRYAGTFNAGTFTDINAVRLQSAALADIASDQTARTVYDAAGRAVFSVDALNYVTETRFDANGNAIRTIAYARAITLPGVVNLANLRTAVDAVLDNAHDRVTRHVYDSTSRERYSIDAMGFVKEIGHDALGRIATITLYHDPITLANLPDAATEADILDALEARTAPSSGFDQTTSYLYDRGGRLESTTDAEAHVESYEYDDVGNKKGLTNKKGSVWTYEYDGLGRLTAEITPTVSVTRVGANLVVTTTDEPVTTRMTYDAFGNVKTRTEAFGTPDARTTTYDYDLLGHQTQTTYPNVGVYDVNTDKLVDRVLDSVTYYDVLGNAIAVRNTSHVDNENGQYSYKYSYKIYDRLGRVKYEIDAERYVTEYTYDTFGNQLTTTRYATALAGNLFSAREANPASGSIQGFTVSDVVAAAVTSAQDRTITNRYDRRNLLTNVLQPIVSNYDSGTDKTFNASPTTGNTYNAFGQVVKQSSLKNLGADDVLGSADDAWIDTFSYYDVKGQRTAQIDALGYLTQYEYDATGNLVRQAEYAAALTNGSWNVDAYGVPVVTAPVNAGSISAIGFDRVTEFDYDRLNHKLTETRVNVQYSSATYGGTASVTSQLGNLTTSYGYDAVGNLVSVTDPGGNATYSYYDALGRTTAVVEPARLSDSPGSIAMPPLSLRNDLGKPVMLTWPVAPVVGTQVRLAYRAKGSGGALAYATTSNVPVDPSRPSSKTIDIHDSSYWIDLGDLPINVYDYTLQYTRAGDSAPYAEGTGSIAVVNTTAAGSFNVAGFVEEPTLDVSSTSGAWTWPPSGDPGSWTSSTISLKWSSLAEWGTGNVRVRIEYTADDFTSAGPVNKVVDKANISASAADTGFSYTWNGGSNPSSYGQLKSVNNVQVWKKIGAIEVEVFKSTNGGDLVVPERLILAGNTASLTSVVVRDANGNSVGARTLSKLSTNLTGSSVYSVDVSDLARGTYTYEPNGIAAGRFEVKGSQSALKRPVIQENSAALKVTSSSGVWIADPSSSTGGSWSSSAIDLSWTPLTQWGAGKVHVRIDYTADDATAPGGPLKKVIDQADISALKNSFHLGWNSGSSPAAYGQLKSLDRVQIWKFVDGVEVKLFDSTKDILSQQLIVSDIPTAATTLTLEYRKRGSNDLYQLKAMKRLLLPAGTSSGWFSANYDDIPNGAYDYRLTALDENGQPVDLTGLGGDAQGHFTGSLNVMRGGQSLPAVAPGASSVLTPLTVLHHDIFGNVLEQTRLANGAASGANAMTYQVNGIDALRDEHTYTFFDTFGRVMRTVDAEAVWRYTSTVDAEAASRYTSYDAAGNVAKQWHDLTNADGGHQDVAQTFEYDNLGRQILLTETSTGDKKETVYNAFGEIVGKGLNGGAQEYFRYDNAGRLWQTNKDDGVAKAYLYNLQGQATAALDSVTVDLHSYSDASSLGALAGGVRRTTTRYDFLGRAIAQMQPSFTNVTSLDAVSGSLSVNSLSLNVSGNSGAWDPTAYYWTDSVIDIKWSSLDQWGNGTIRVRIDYTADDATAAGGPTKKVFDKDGISAVNSGYRYVWNGGSSRSGYGQLRSIDRVQVWKIVDGVEVKFFDGGDQIKPAILTWPVTPVMGTQVRLAYWAKGNPGAVRYAKTANGLPGPTDKTIEVRGSRYWVDLGDLPIDLYDYTIQYTRTGESSPYAEGAGSLAVVSTTSVGSLNVAGFVSVIDQAAPERLILNGKTTGLTGVIVRDANGVVVDTRTLANGKVTSMGGGAFAVNVGDLARGTYTYEPIGTASTAAGRFQVKGSQGAVTRMAIQDRTLSLNLSTTSGSWNASTNSWSSSFIDLNWTPLAQWGAGSVRVRIDYTADDYTGAGPLKKVVDQANLSALQNSYRYTWNAGTNTAGYGELKSLDRVQVWKVVDGVEVKLFDTNKDVFSQQLMISGIPTTATTLNLEYRKRGTNDPYQLKTTTRLLTAAGASSGWFSASYDNIPNGVYDYRFTALNANGQPIDLTSIGGNTQGQIAGNVEIVRGGQSLITVSTVMTATVVSTTTQTHDRWGNVLSVTDPRNATWATDFRYDYLNHVIEKIQPTTDIWNESGVDLRTDGDSGNDRPVTRTYYDKFGLEIASVDPNGNLSARSYDEAGHVVREYHTDGGLVKYTYDIFGREIARTDANGNIASSVYNRNNLLVTQQTPASNLTYQYDEEGHRIRITNGLGETTRYFYDARGNLVRTRLPMGGSDVNTIYFTAATYDASGRKLSERNGNGSTNGNNGDIQSWDYDYFGRLKTHTDLGGGVTTYFYDQISGRLLRQTRSGGENPGQDLYYEYYENGALRRTIDNALKTVSTCVYDAASQKTREQFSNFSTGEIFTDVRIAYDEQGRVTGTKDLRYETTYLYDANGNRRNISATYYDNAGARQTQNYWYRYDVMNRITLSQGQLVNGQIAISTSQGIQLAYDANGNRRSANFYENGILVNEGYNFDALNRLTQTSRGGKQTSARAYDLAGRVTDYISYSSPGIIRDTQHSSYNANGWLTSSVSKNASGQTTQTLTYSQYDAVGNVKKYTLNVPQGTSYTNTYTKSYIKLDGYRESKVHATSTYFPTGDTTETYDVNGNLVQVEDHFNTNKSRDFIVTTQGQVLRKNENDKTEYYFYANGNPVGSVGDIGGANANFDYNYTAVSDQYPSSTPSQYTVSQGDTLQGIALAVYGDAKLWYFIADANGLKGDGSDLQPGQALTIPNQISNLYNSHATHKVYSPGDIIGNTTPTLPNPPASAGSSQCNVAAMVIMAAVAIIATFLTAGLATSVGIPAVLAAGIGGAAGSIASQYIGIRLGVVKEISWGAVAAGAFTSFVTAGMGDVAGGLFKAIGISSPSPILNAAINGMVNNAVSQGINILMRQQESFNWGSVAFAGFFASTQANAAMRFNIGGSDPQAARPFNFMDVATNTGIGIVRGAISQAISNNGKIDWTSVCTDAFGSALGNSIVGAMRFGDAETKVNLMSPVIRSAYDVLARSNPNDIEANIKAAETLVQHAAGGVTTLTTGEKVEYDERKQAAYEHAMAANGADKPNGDAMATGALVDTCRMVDSISDSIDALMKTGADNALLQDLMKTREVFTAALVSQECYFDGEGVPEILPRGVNRLTGEQVFKRSGGMFTNDLFRDDRIGYRGVLYENTNSSSGSAYIYANRGSEMQGNDWANNFAQAFGFKSEQYEKAIQVADALNSVDKFAGDRLSFTGHSLGGGLAQAQALRINRRAIVFDSAALNQATIKRFELNDKNAAEQITAFNIKGEILSSLQDSPISDALAVALTPAVNLMAEISATGEMLAGKYPVFANPQIPSSLGVRTATPVVYANPHVTGDRFSLTSYDPLQEVFSTFSSHLPNYMVASLKMRVGENLALPSDYLTNIHVR